MAFGELKQRQSVMWGNGPYQGITETVTDIHARVIELLAPQLGIRWLDLACGTGAVAELAARAGASVTGVDLAPALIETARQRAQEQKFEIDYRVGDCERLDLDDASYDRLSSTCGIMFAPDHAATAHELARVVVPGGRIALANWTPDGGLGQMFKMMRPFMPTPPPSAGDPFAWGREEVVRELLGDAFELDIEECVSTLNIPTGEEYWQLFSSSYGPTKTAAKRSTKTGAMSSIRHGSTSSTRTTGRTAASLTRGSTCSSWASDAERPAGARWHMWKRLRGVTAILTPQPGSTRGTDLTTGDGSRQLATLEGRPVSGGRRRPCRGAPSSGRRSRPGAGRPARTAAPGPRPSSGR
jgi:SAM-dependent methyltransferase